MAQTRFGPRTRWSGMFGMHIWRILLVLNKCSVHEDLITVQFSVRCQESVRAFFRSSEIGRSTRQFSSQTAI